MCWIYFTLLTRGTWGLYNQWSATAISRGQRRSTRMPTVARTPNNRSLLLLAFKLFQGLRDLSPASARRRLQPARGPVLGVTGVQLVPMIYLRWGRSAGLPAAAGLAAAALLTTHGRNLVCFCVSIGVVPGRCEGHRSKFLGSPVLFARDQCSACGTLVERKSNSPKFTSSWGVSASRARRATDPTAAGRAA